MGVGILGKTILELPFGGRPLLVKDASVVPGVTCEVHGLTPTQACALLRMLLPRAEGVDVCAPCVTVVRDFLKAKLRRTT